MAVRDELAKAAAKIQEARILEAGSLDPAGLGDAEARYQEAEQALADRRFPEATQLARRS